MEIATKHWNPTRLGTDLRFIFFVTLFFGAIGFLMNAGHLSFIGQNIAPRPEGSEWWFIMAALVGIVLPLVGVILFFKYDIIRRVLGNLLIVLGAQIGFEAIAANNFFPSVIVYSAVFYVAFRLWQLWEGNKTIAKCCYVPEPIKKTVRAILNLNFVLWSAVLLHLLTQRIPTIY